MARRSYNVMTIAVRHPVLFSRMHKRSHLEFWPTKTSGVHIAAVMRRKGVNEVSHHGVLWLEAA